MILANGMLARIRIQEQAGLARKKHGIDQSLNDDYQHVVNVRLLGLRYGKVGT